MRLDRNSVDGRQKYAILKLRRLEQIRNSDGGDGEVADKVAVEAAISLLERAGILDWGKTTESEFFVLRLRDKYADDALYRYALAAAHDGDGDYAREIEELAGRAGANNPYCKEPD